MANRQGTPSSDPAEQLARAINGNTEAAERAARDIARGALPEPLTWQVTTVAPGPPPVFQVAILNPLTGATIVLGVI